jgi:predicted PurR-regulated permease PerM
MPSPQPIERLHLTARSAVLAVALLGGTLALLRLVQSSQRVLGWILTAAAVAGLLHPLVALFQRRMPRAAAVAVVVILTAGLGGLVAYGTVGGLVHEERKLEQAIPKRAAELEKSKRFGKAAREFKLEARTRRFVKEVPARLRGGTPADALRSAATRGVAFLATGVLSIFFLLHGPRIARSAAGQIRDVQLRIRVENLAAAGYHRGLGYARGSLAIAVIAGSLAYVVGKVTSIPGPAPLALWVGMWDLVPVVGTFVGALPIVVLAGVHSTTSAVVVGLIFAAFQVFEHYALQKPLEARTVRLGPFLTVAGGFAGLELYGIGGALMVLLVASIAVAVADEWAPDE